MKSKNIKKAIEVLPMKKGESLTNVKTKVGLAQIPEEFTINSNADVLFVLLNKKTGEYLGNIKIVYSEAEISQLGLKIRKRIANVTVSELSPTIQDDIYIKLMNCLHNQAIYGKFANYVQINRETLSEKTEAIVLKSRFKEHRMNSQILEINVEATIFLCLFIIFMCL